MTDVNDTGDKSDTPITNVTATKNNEQPSPLGTDDGKTDAGIASAGGNGHDVATTTGDTTMNRADADPSVVPASDVAKRMNVSPSEGLSSDEAASRLKGYGGNKLEGKPPVPKWKRFLKQFQDPLVYLLLAATVISVIAWGIEQSQGTSGEALPFDALVIVLILIVNAVLGYIQENRAEAAVAALASMTAPHSTVLRDGKAVQVDTTTIVPGDVLILAEGDSVPADGRLIQAASLRIAEASLTGESVPVGKSVDTLDSVKSLGDRSNMVFRGTSVTQGTGRAVVTATGMKTQVGKIADMLDDEKDDATPLQKEMDHVAKILGIAVCIIAVVVLGALAVMEGFHSLQDAIDSLLLSVSLAVAAVPEGLATVLTVVLALGVQRMAKRHAIVKRLSSVETLGSASVICSDKTGTLTKNEMTVERIVTASGDSKVTGDGYVPKGVITDSDGNDVTGSIMGEIEMSLLAGSLANDGELRESDGKYEPIGDPTEVSLIVAARKTSAWKRVKSWNRVAEIPFTSDRKRQSVVASNDADGGKLTVFAKGAPDVLLGFCDRIYVNGSVRKLTEGDRQDILATVESLSKDAYRTLGTAYRPLDVNSLSDVEGMAVNSAGQALDIADQPDVIESSLIWTGMVGIIDPPRTEVRDAVAEAHKAGIRTVMITGDHPLTAARIASDLGIIKPGEKALTGDQLDELKEKGEKAFDEAIASTSVYARVAPEHKLLIVKSLQRQGNIVAMTGDGVNDAPAVKSADIGVAMGITGTEVTKESAKMILADDNFGTIVNAVEEGRGIFDNVRKFLRYLLGSNVGEVLTVFFGVVLAGVLGIAQPESTGVTVPLLATQLLWINLLTDAAPALAMGVDPQTDDVMSRKPRKLTDRVIDLDMWIDIIVIGLAMAAVTLIGMDMHLAGGLFTDRSVSAMGHEAQLTEARTMGFTILVFAQLFNALASRSDRRSVFHGLFSNGWLWGAIVLSIVLQLVVIYVPFLNVAFGTTPLPPMAWVECIGLAAVVLVVSEVYKAIMRAVDKVKA